MNYTTLARSIIRGDRKAAARLISVVEDEEEGYGEAMDMIFSASGRAGVLGITGAPGVGKSTLVFELAKGFRKEGKSVGIVAVDPTSPLTGGAILGDRIRMPELSSDPGVFIRSMGSRGGTGGLSLQASATVRILDALGCEEIIVETVGAGQTQVDIMGLADTVVVVTMPGSGDEVQSIKAGLLEIADIYVVNKMDLPGSMSTAADLRAMIDLVDDWKGWKPPVLLASASGARGLGEVSDSIRRHREWFSDPEAHMERRARQARKEIYDIIANGILRAISSAVPDKEMGELVRLVAERKMSPYDAARKIAGSALPGADLHKAL